jgi:hypothetical protein
LIKCEQITRVLARLCLGFTLVHPVKQVREVFASILLLTRLEVRMTLPKVVLEDLWSDAVLVVLIRLFGCWILFRVHFLREFLLAVLS